MLALVGYHILTPTWPTQMALRWLQHGRRLVGIFALVVVLGLILIPLLVLLLALVLVRVPINPSEYDYDYDYEYECDEYDEYDECDEYDEYDCLEHPHKCEGDEDEAEGEYE